MNVSRMKKPELMAELEKRSLPTNGLKDELKFRLIEAIEKEKGNDVLNVDESDESCDEIQSINLSGNIDKDTIIEDVRDEIANIGEETLKEDEIIGTDQSAVLTVEDAIKMKTTHEIESESMIVNINEDDDNDDSMSNSANEDNVNSLQTINNSNRELDNGDHEIIEISEEVVIDDEDNQENDNNYNDLSSDSNQPQSRDMENEMEKIDSTRKDDQMKIQSKTEIWVTNIAEDVKAVELKELFGKYGKVVSAKVVMNAKNPTGSCFGCIQLASANDVKACVMNLDQKEFHGNIISITNDMNDKAANKESIIRNISPVSSSASWGSKNKSGDKKSSKSPLDSNAPSSYNKMRNDQTDKDRRPPYREKPSSGGGFYKSKDFSDRGSINRRGNRPQYNDDRRQNYSERSGGKQYYKGSNNVNYNSTGGNSYTDSRNRDVYRKSSRDNRDNYNTHSYESRYVPSNSGRDKPPGRSDYGGDRVNKTSSNFNDYRSRSNKYENYDDYARRDKRSVYDRPVSREIDNYSSSSKRDTYKRPRPEDSDDYLHSKKRRPDIIDERPHHYRNVESPKKYYSEKDYRKPDYKSRRDDYPGDYPSKTDRDYFPARRNADYPVRRDAYEAFSPDRHASRSNHYSKDSYVQHSTDFGGRSRRY